MRQALANTALNEAAASGHEACLVRLLDNQADVSVTSNIGETALMHAGACGCEGCLARLLDAKANVAAVSNPGADALIYSATGGHATCVAMLLKAKADVKAECSGHTALSAAKTQGHTTCVELQEKACSMSRDIGSSFFSRIYGLRHAGLLRGDNARFVKWGHRVGTNASAHTQQSKNT